jgi:hypothetical protein
MHAIVSGTCQQCAADAPVQYLSFWFNIGLLVMRFHKKMEGQFCHACASSIGWKYFLTSFFLGWWGVISFFFNFFCVGNNIVNLLKLRNYPKQ